MLNIGGRNNKIHNLHAVNNNDITVLLLLYCLDTFFVPGSFVQNIMGLKAICKA